MCKLTAHASNIELIIDTHQSLITRNFHGVSSVAAVDKSSNVTIILVKTIRKGRLSPKLISIFLMNRMLQLHNYR